ncbi:MAG TPA: secretin N-terminal domain-containing protein [Edaphobacter sp.]|jgi:type II secretory pathway component GspD/PulD (secretin)|nr:secretin N-terminal domain-containing protein [Edaphobacter sp.]
MKMRRTMQGRYMMRFVCGILEVTLILVATAGAQTTEKSPTTQQDSFGHVDTRPMQSFHLMNISSQNDANEVAVALRNLLDPSVKVFLVPNQNTIVMRGSTEQIALAQKVVSELDRPKKLYRLTYTMTDLEGGKRVGVQHFSMVVTEGQRTVMKQGNKVPIMTGSYNNASSQAESQVTFIDIGMNFDATLDSYSNGTRLKTKVEQIGVAEEKSGLGPQDPIFRQTALEGTVLLVPGKAMVLGALDIPGSTRHVDVDVMMEPIG